MPESLFQCSLHHRRDVIHHVLQQYHCPTLATYQRTRTHGKIAVHMKNPRRSENAHIPRNFQMNQTWHKCHKPEYAGIRKSESANNDELEIARKPLPPQKARILNDEECHERSLGWRDDSDLELYLSRPSHRRQLLFTDIRNSSITRIQEALILPIDSRSG